MQTPAPKCYLTSVPFFRTMDGRTDDFFAWHRDSTVPENGPACNTSLTSPALNCLLFVNSTVVRLTCSYQYNHQAVHYYYYNVFRDSYNSR